MCNNGCIDTQWCYTVFVAASATHKKGVSDANKQLTNYATAIVAKLRQS
jgi:hypothetical protein